MAGKGQEYRQRASQEVIKNFQGRNQKRLGEGSRGNGEEMSGTSRGIRGP